MCSLMVRCVHLNPHAKQDWYWDSLNSELDHAAPGRLSPLACRGAPRLIAQAEAQPTVAIRYAICCAAAGGGSMLREAR